jgi:hypothetical protein
MTQEQKELLLKDLCARLPYGVKVNNEIQGDFSIYGICENYVFGRNEICHIDFDVEKIKPYLIPLSKMTEEQREELYKIGWYLDEDKIYSCFRNYDDTNYKTHTDCFELINWCYKNKLDIKGFIHMGLAIDATDKNIY